MASSSRSTSLRCKLSAFVPFLPTAPVVPEKLLDGAGPVNQSNNDLPHYFSLRGTATSGAVTSRVLDTKSWQRPHPLGNFAGMQIHPILSRSFLLPPLHRTSSSDCHVTNSGSVITGPHQIPGTWQVCGKIRKSSCRSVSHILSTISKAASSESTSTCR